MRDTIVFLLFHSSSKCKYKKCSFLLAKLIYKQILDQTLTEYNNTCIRLRLENKLEEAECLEKAILFVNNDFIFCYNQKVILSIWGMEVKDYSIHPVGVAMKVIRKPKSKPVEETYTIHYDAGEYGNLIGSNDVVYKKGVLISENDVPTISAHDGFEFIGWDKNPIMICFCKAWPT
jgi:hypothetical protein